MIEQSIPFIQKLAALVHDHVPAEQLPSAIRIIIPMLLLGVGLSVFGAKLARPFLAVLFAGVGLKLGLSLQDQIHLPHVLLAVAGVGVAGLIGYFGFRLWAAGLIAVLAVTVALGIYSQKNIVPHYQSFESSVIAGTSDFTIPDAQAKDVPAHERLADMADAFWAHVRKQNANVDQSIQRVVLAVGIVGFVISICCIRWALILASSATGIFLTATGVLAAVYASSPVRYESLAGHDTKVGLAILAAFLFSVFLQAQLTKKRKVVSVEVEDEE